MTKQIESMDYCTIISDKKMKGSGLVQGDIVLITSHKDVAVSGKDPYLTRRYVLALRVVDGVHQIPKDGNDYMSYLIDPRNIERVSEDKREELENALELQYSRN